MRSVWTVCVGVALALPALSIASARAATDCVALGGFLIEIKNTSAAQIDHLLLMDLLDENRISDLRLSPGATVGLCMSKRPAKCKIVYQVSYVDYPPISYEQDICKNPKIRIKKE